MRKSKYNSSGSGPKPNLGSGKPRFSSRPGGGNGFGGVAGHTPGPKAARPGGATKAPRGRGSAAGSVARPGGAQGVNR